MLSQNLKAGAALILLAIGGSPALAKIQAQDPDASATNITQIVLVKTTSAGRVHTKTER